MRENAKKSVIREFDAIYKCQPLEFGAFCEPGEQRVGEIAAEVHKVEPPHEPCVIKRFLIRPDNLEHLNKAGEVREAGSVPKRFDGAFAPCAAYEESTVDIAG